ncbi:MAG: response regulator [Bacteroidetes bacterium]|nr:response regulator [Bacteroidota bacterium]
MDHLSRIAELEQKVKQLESLAAFPANNPNPLFFMNEFGEVLFQNPAAELIQSIQYERKSYTPQEFWKHVAPTLDIQNKKRAYVEFQSSGVRYGSLCVIDQENKKISAYTHSLEDQRIQIDQIFSSLNQEISGILLENHQRKIVYVNKKFVELFNSPVSEDDLVGVDCSSIAQVVKKLFVGEELFVERVNEIFEKRNLSLNELLELKDGRFFERDYIPVFVDGEQSGHLWKYTDVTDRVLAEKRLRNREAKFKGIIDNFHLGLLEVAPDGKIITANEAFCEMTGYSLSEMIGHDGGELFLDASERERMRERNESRRVGVNDVYELRVFNKKNEPRYWLVSAAPRLSDDGEIVGSIGIHWDITHMKELEIQLTESRKKAEDSSQAKAMFLANMSHEIRTPLNGIVSMAEQLSKSGLNSDQSRFVDIMTSASSTLLAIINDVLDISKIEAGKFSVETIPFDFTKSSEDALSIFKAKAQEKNINYSYSFIGFDAMGLLLGDPYRLNQVLFNIVGNAIKFTHKGRVSVQIEMLSRQSQKVEIRIRVEDTGVGMDPGYLQRVYEAFSQEDNSITRKFGGSGLGLSIARSIIQTMGGDLQIESYKGRGTTVTIDFSLIETSVKRANSQTLDSNQVDLSKVKVLAVEDNELNKMVLQVVLKKYGCHIEIASNGEEALEILTAQDFDIILMDVQMPVMDGIEATRIIREKRNITTPIIGLSANALREEVTICKSAGMNDYLVKPYTEKQLMEVMLSYIKGIHVTLPVAQEEAKLDLTVLRQYVGDNEEMLNQVIGGYLLHLPPQMERLEKAILEEDVLALRHELHQLKATMEIIGVRPNPLSFQDLSVHLKGDGVTSNVKESVLNLLKQGRAAIQALRDRK